MIEKEIENWQESILALPDKIFFNTMRLYLGEIKTPYNKQRLVSQLASFIKNEKNTNAILTLLDETDVKVLTAISKISNVTQEILVDFFKGSFSSTEIFSEIINLQERLIIFTKENFGKNLLFINPFLKEALKPYLNLSLLLPVSQVQNFSQKDNFILSPNFLASFISFVRMYGISCKADGNLKKNDIQRLETVFPQKQKCIQLLVNAFINLSLLKENEKGFELDDLRIQTFAEFLPELQYALLTAASVSRFSIEGLRKESQLLLDVISSIPETGFSRDSILKMTFLIGSYTKEGDAFTKKSRFLRMLEDAKKDESFDVSQNANLLDRMIDSAIEFGLLISLGTNSENQEIYIKSQTNQFSEDSDLKVLNIDATFFVTIMPGLSLKKLLPLTNFLLIKKCEVVTEFEITKKSVSISFDKMWTPEKIFSEMEKFSYYELPKNLKINILEWYTSYSSAMLYHGYILKVQDKNLTFVENNPIIKKYLKEKLAAGIYLLNIPYDKDVSNFIKESGIDFLGKVKESNSFSEHIIFPNLTSGRKSDLLVQNSDEKFEKTSLEKAKNLQKNLKLALENKDIDKNLKVSLEHRISSRMILSLEQLEIANIRTEIIEADGMDFAGKIHLIEAAIKDKEILEIEISQQNSTIIGIPQILSKQIGEAVLRFQVEPSKEIITILVSKISHLKRLIF